MDSASHRDIGGVSSPGDHGRLTTSSSVKLLLIGLIACWALELLWLQHVTAFPNADIPVGRAIKDAFRRFVLNAAACTAMVCLLHHWIQRSLFLVGFLAFNTLIVVANYFGHPLSWPMLTMQWREGVGVAHHGLSLVSPWTLLLTGLACGAKWLLLSKSRTYPGDSRALRKTGAWACVIYLVCAVGLLRHKPIQRIHMGTPQYIYGYTLAWTAEALTYDHDGLLNLALEKAAAKSDRLSRLERPLPLGTHVAIIQVESLDYDILEAKVDGTDVMPFLRSLASQARRYSVKPFHNTGSSEADFSTLTTCTPNGKVNPFQIAGFPYDDTLARSARGAGYRTVAMHGNTGEFFHRRSAYEQMGFDEIFFTEELRRLEIDGSWDKALLNHSADLLVSASEPTLHFLITITSHGPFDRLDANQRRLHRSPRNETEHYRNSMRYVDEALADYIDRIPPGTTVVIYGDHESGVHGYADPSQHTDHVPWLIYQKPSEQLVGIPADNGANDDAKLASSGTDRERDSQDHWSQLDLVCYLKDGFRARQLAREGSEGSASLRR
ncbi:MAG: LTA synthase family protein [Planctomycetota bacterium]